jgi:CheY-like chemotaxis protein/MinD-like ATPase involved in chromosome partitioning or flagellar assembly
VANIYVIDDDDQLLRMVGLMLERGGHTATLISNPIEGLEQIREEPPDAIVLDVMMPNMSGHDVCREIRADQQIANLPILVLTARAQAVDREAALKSGANDYLSKPVNAQDLIEKVDNLLTNPKSSSPQKEAFIVGFMGMMGGVGRTTLAANFCGALRRISQDEVCLVELTPSGGQASMHFRLQAKSSWADLPPAEALDWDALKKHLTLHPTGLRLLASPTMFTSPSEPTAELVKKILQILGEEMAAVVVDLPAIFNPAFQAAVAGSDIIFHVVNPTVISVQVAQHTNQALVEKGFTNKQPLHILNQVSADNPLPSSAVEKGLHAKLAFQVRYDANQPSALMQGVPLTHTSAQSPLPVTIRRMAGALWQRTHQTS